MGTRPLIAAAALSVCLLTACATGRPAPPPTSAPAAALEAADLRLAELRADLARLAAHRNVLFEAARGNDPLADVVQLVCAQERLGDARHFATRARHAHRGVRDAVVAGDGRETRHRLRLLQIAREGVALQLRGVRSCAPGARTARL